MLNDMAQTLCPMVLQEGLNTGAGEAPEKASRKASRCRAYSHGQDREVGNVWGVTASGRAWGWGGLAVTRVDGKAGLLSTIRIITDSLTFFSERVTEQIPLFFFNQQEKNCISFITLIFLPILMCLYLFIKPS